MFERSLSNSFRVFFASGSIADVCMFGLLVCLLCICFYAKTYIFLLICTELCLVTICFLILVSFPSVGGVVLSFMYILLAAGETALLLVMVFVFGENTKVVPFSSRVHYPGV